MTVTISDSERASACRSCAAAPCVSLALFAQAISAVPALVGSPIINNDRLRDRTGIIRSILFHHFVPASICGGKTAFPALLNIDRALRQCKHSDDLARVVEEGKLKLLSELRPRFELTVAKALALKMMNICQA